MASLAELLHQAEMHTKGIPRIITGIPGCSRTCWLLAACTSQVRHKQGFWVVSVYAYGTRKQPVLLVNLMLLQQTGVSLDWEGFEGCTQV